MPARVCIYEGGLVLCSGYVLETKQGLIAIDAPSGITKWIVKNFPDKKVTDLLLTHMHFDHIEDVAVMREAYGCRVHACCAYDLKLTLADLANAAWGMSLHIEPFLVDSVLGTQAKEADWGGLAWKIYHVPGHSQDSLAFHLPEQGIIFSGDALFNGSIGRTDFPGGDLETLLESIRSQLLTLDVHTRVYPGHGASTTIGEELISNPYLT